MWRLVRRHLSQALVTPADRYSRWDGPPNPFRAKEWSGGGRMDTGMAAVESAQRRDALAHANRVRVARAKLKRGIASGEASVAEVVLFPRWDTDTMPLRDLLASQRNWGEVRCRRVLTAMRLNDGKTVGSLTARQRGVLAAWLNSPGRTGD